MVAEDGKEKELKQDLTLEEFMSSKTQSIHEKTSAQGAAQQQDGKVSTQRQSFYPPIADREKQFRKSKKGKGKDNTFAPEQWNSPEMKKF